MSARALTPAHLRLIEAMADQLVLNYLRPEPAPVLASDAERSERVPLPDLDKAA